MLPTLPSDLLDRSASSPDLRSQRQAVGFSNAAPPRSANSAYSLVDRTATALPQYLPAHATPTHHLNEPSSRFASSNLREEVLDSPRVPSLTAKPAVTKTWRKLAEQVKKVFEFGRRRKKGKDKEEAARPKMQIGSPTNFEHRETGGLRPLRTADGTINPNPTTPGADNGASRVRFADTVEYVGSSPPATSQGGPSRGAALTSHPRVMVFGERAGAKTEDDDEDGDDEWSDGSHYDDDSDSSTNSDENGWKCSLAS